MKPTWIKAPIVLFAALLVAIGFFSYFVVLIGQKGPFFFHGSNAETTAILNNFRQSHRPLIEVNLSALYGGNGQFQVLHPLLDMGNLKYREENPTCSGDDDSEVATNRSFIESMKETSSDNFFLQKKQVSRKLEILQQFLSQEGKLPDDFVVTPPFVDDWGDSFAYRLTQNASAPFNEKAWVEEHLSFFKISELEKVLERFQINDLRYLVLSRLTEAEVEDLIKADSLVVSKDYLFLKNRSRFGFSPLSYWVYDMRDFRADLKSTKYDLSEFVAGSTCLEKTGNGCWTYNSNHMMSYLYKYSVLIIALIGLIVVICFVFYLRSLYQKNREQQKNRLALQVLSHEFRTPVSSMLLMLERLARNTSRLEMADQDLVTRISTEAYRLQRIIEVSKTYLQAESHRVHFNYVEVSSINTWISDFVSEGSLPVECDLLTVDRSLSVDPFWLKFVLSNLIQNALTHGQGPVFIRLKSEGDSVKMTVEDQGRCEFRSLGEMTDAFVKSGRSKGMGLGLNIVKSILDEWGVEIQFSTLPTSFSLLFVGSRRG